MRPIDEDKYPLFSRMAGALFQGIGRTISSEDQLPAYLLTHFREREFDKLLAELREISAKDLSDEEWETYWYNSPAFSFPKSAAASKRLIQRVIDEIMKQRRRK